MRLGCKHTDTKQIAEKKNKRGCRQISLVTAAVALLEIEKPSSPGFFLSSTPLMQTYIVKMTYSCPKMPCPYRI
jgi:hypothetical protein